MAWELIPTLSKNQRKRRNNCDTIIIISKIVFALERKHFISTIVIILTADNVKGF